jgi:hypothetical protein
MLWRKEWNVASAVSGKHGRLFEHSIPIHSEPDSAPIKHIFSKITKPIEIGADISTLVRLIEEGWI